MEADILVETLVTKSHKPDDQIACFGLLIRREPGSVSRQGMWNSWRIIWRWARDCVVLFSLKPVSLTLLHGQTYFRTVDTP